MNLLAARQRAVDRLTALGQREMHGQDPLEVLGSAGATDWDCLTAAARLALQGRREGLPVFRQVLDAPGYAASASGLEVGLAALGLALLEGGDALERLEALKVWPHNGLDVDLAAALTLARGL